MKILDQDWIGIRKFLMLLCDYSKHIKTFSCYPIRFYRYFAISGKSSAGNILQFELFPPLSTYTVEFLLQRERG